jgi:hypothetical protein
VIEAQPGDRQADLARLVALELAAHGAEAAAARFRARAEALYRARLATDTAGDADRAALARVLYESGKLDEAGRLFSELAARQPTSLEAQGRLGTIAARRGDGATAQRVDAWMAAQRRPYLHGAHTLWRARLAALRGDHAGAASLVRQARAEGASYGVALHQDPDLAGLRDVPAFNDLLRPKE